MAGLGDIPESLLDLIYDAAGDAAVWNAVLADIAHRLDSAGGVLYGQSIRAKTVFFENNGGLCDEASRRYRKRHIHNAWSLHMMVQPDGKAVASDEVLALADLRKSDFYADVLAPQGLAHSAMMGLVSNSKFVAAFNICRTPRQGPYRPAELGFLERLAPHIQRALRLGFRVDAYRALQAAQFEVLDRFDMGVVLLDRRGSVLYCNRAAQHDASLLIRDRRVTHASPYYARRLEALISDAVAGVPLRGLTLPAEAEDLPVIVLATPVRSNEADRLGDGALQEAAAILFLSAPGAAGRAGTAWLRDLFGLTPAEAAIAAAAATGANVPAIARSLSVSSNTVKTHLRHVFAKTGAKGQAELVRLLMPPSLVTTAIT